jgi:hypothetical protein
MPDRDWFNRLARTPVGSEFMTPSNLDDLAEHIRERVTVEDALPVCGALARRLAEALRTIEDLREEIANLKGLSR